MKNILIQEFFLIHIFPHSDWFTGESPYLVQTRGNTDQETSKYGRFFCSAYYTSWCILKFIFRLRNISINILKSWSFTHWKDNDEESRVIESSGFYYSLGRKTKISEDVQHVFWTSCVCSVFVVYSRCSFLEKKLYETPFSAEINT